MLIKNCNLGASGWDNTALNCGCAINKAMKEIILQTNYI